jgi:hypothetical protein
MLDKSGRGNHATQATTASRPTYGVVPLGGRRNLLTFTEQFDNAVWGKNGAIVSGSAGSQKLVEAAITGEHLIYVNAGISTTSGQSYKFFADVTSAERTQCYFSFTTSGLRSGSYFNLTALTTTPDAGVTATITDIGGGKRRCSISQTVGSTATRFPAIFTAAAGSITTVGTGVEGIIVHNSQLELGSTATAYQKVTTQYDVTEAGVQSLSYLSFDGAATFMVTNTITPAIDKAQIFAGVQKLSDAGQRVVAEMSATIASNAGAFALTAPNSAAANYNFSSKGTIQTDNVVTTYTAPITSVLSGLGDIAGASNLIRVNGTQIGSTLTTQGTGNYLAYPLYIGRRAGTTLPLHGQIYSLIVRFGANLTTDTITSTETYVGDKTGINILNNISPTIFARDNTAVLDRFNAIIERRAV